MKIILFVFVYLIGAHSSLIRKKILDNDDDDDDFILQLTPTRNKNSKNSEDSFVRNSKDESGFVLTPPKTNEIDDKLKYVKKEGKGTFWHLTDLHLDFYYNQHDSLQSVCPSSNGVAAENPGPYGDYRCDSPLKLVNSSIYAMKNINPNPDFILWTGDDTLHTNDEEKYLPEELVFDTVNTITELIYEAFPNTNVFPALGNHDFYPKNQMPVGPSRLLANISDLWSIWLDVASYDSFKSDGFYSTKSSKAPNLEIFVLNTNIWYSSNKLINTSDSDPGGQFAYLRSVLNRAVTEGTKVYIIGHIPPGYFEPVDYMYWLYPVYNSQYVSMVKQYSHVIAGQFFAHHHTDSFRIFQDEGRSVSTAWIAPGVSPWMTTLPGVENGANNPGIRLFEYDKVTLEPTNYLQYYLDLEKANNDGNAEWKLEYNAVDAYKLNSISRSDMETLYKTLKEADVNCDACESNKLLQKFSLYNTVSYNKDYCDERCQRLHTCAVSQLEEKGYLECVNSAAILRVNQLWLFVASSLLITTYWN